MDSTAHTNYLLCKSLSHLMKTKLTIQYTNSQILLEISSITNYIGDVPDGRFNLCTRLSTFSCTDVLNLRTHLMGTYTVYFIVSCKNRIATSLF